MSAAPLLAEPVEAFEKTDKQIEACDVMRDHEITMLEGGARSGKTFIIIRQQIVRGIKYKILHEFVHGCSAASELLKIPAT